MNPRSRRFPLLLLVLAAACGTETEPVPDAFGTRLASLPVEDEAPDKLALLVGIDTYAPRTSDEFPNLRGCVNDTRRWAALLEEGFGFAPENVFVMTDAEATHANIVRAFREVLIERAGVETEAFFYFSGHGSQVPDESGADLAESDGFDSTFLAYDSRVRGRDGERDLTDDELRCLVAALTEKTDRVTVVTDSCHSGGGLRSPARAFPRRAPPGTRTLDRDWLASFWPEDVPFHEDGPGDLLREQDYIHVAACRRDQLAYEFADDTAEGDERFHGALTYFLTHYLERAQPETSWRSVIDDAAAHLSTHFVSQTVTYSGALDRTLFDGEFERVEGFLASAVEGDRVRVQAGSMFGLRPGSVLEVRDAQGRRLLGEVEVERLQGTAALCTWRDGVPDDVPRGAMRAIETVRSGAQQPLDVWVPEAVLRAFVANSDWLTPHAEPAGADYVLREDASGLRFETIDGIPATEGGRIELPEDAEQHLAALEAELREEVQWRSMVQLGLERGRYPLDVRFASSAPEELAARVQASAVPIEILESERASAGQTVRVVGGYESDAAFAVGFLTITNPHDVPLYAHVLSLPEDRSVNPIFPREGNPAVQLAPGASEELPIAVLAREQWTLPRPMRDRYVVLATRSRADFSPFRANATMRSAPTEGPDLLEVAFDASVKSTRRAEIDPDDWGATQLDLLVEKPKPRE